MSSWTSISVPHAPHDRGACAGTAEVAVTGEIGALSCRLAEHGRQARQCVLCANMCTVVETLVRFQVVCRQMLLLGAHALAQLRWP